MNRAQKIAVYNLVVFGFSSMLTITAIVTLYYLFGWPVAAAGLGFMGISGLAGLSPLIFKKDPGAVTFDERDTLIHRTSALAGFAVSYLWFCLTGTAFIFLFEPKMLQRFGLPLMVFGGMIVVETVRSIVLLVQYSRGPKGEKS